MILFKSFDEFTFSELIGGIFGWIILTFDFSTWSFQERTELPGGNSSSSNNFPNESLGLYNLSLLKNLNWNF